MPLIPLLFAAAAGGALSIPNLLAANSTYPPDALRAGKSAGANIALVVDAQGRVARCDTRETFGDPAFGRQFCALISANHYKPAKARDGSPVWYRFDGLYTMFLSDTAQGRQMQALQANQPAAGELAVSRLPGGVNRARVAVLLLVDPTGAVTDCQAGPTEKQSALVTAVCANRAALSQAPLTDAAGAAVSYVTNLKLDLVVDGSAPN